MIYERYGRARDESRVTPPASSVRRLHNLPATRHRRHRPGPFHPARPPEGGAWLILGGPHKPPAGAKRTLYPRPARLCFSWKRACSVRRGRGADNVRPPGPLGMAVAQGKPPGFRLAARFGSCKGGRSRHRGRAAARRRDGRPRRLRPVQRIEDRFGGHQSSFRPQHYGPARRAGSGSKRAANVKNRLRQPCGKDSARTRKGAK